jgi:hypothetical protein
MTSTVTLRYVGGTRGECGSGGGRGLVNFASVPAGPGFSNLLGGGGAAAVSRSHAAGARLSRLLASTLAGAVDVAARYALHGYDSRRRPGSTRPA